MPSNSHKVTAHRTIKIVALLGFALIIVALVVAWNSPAVGYEASIYSATPPIVWVGTIFAIVCGIGIVIHQIYAKEHEQSNLWILGLLLVGLGIAVIVSMQVIRGYALWGRGDGPTHLGIAQDVISSGHIGRWNFYPLTHVFLAQLSFLFNIAPIIIYKYMPLFFALLYAAFMYLLARAILPDKGQVIFATLAGIASITFLHDYHNTLLLNPAHLANLFFPLAIFLLIASYAGSKSGFIPQFSLLFIIMIFFIPMFHPILGFVLLLILLTIWLPHRILGKAKDGNPARIALSRPQLRVNVVLILFVWLFTWVSSFYIFEALIRNLHEIFMGEAVTELDFLAKDMQYAQQYGYSPVAQFFKVYGCGLIYALLTLVSIPIVLRRLRVDRGFTFLNSLYGPIGGLVFITGLLYILNLTSPTRAVPYVIMLSTIFTGFTLYWIIQKAQQLHRYHYLPKLGALLVLLILISVFIAGILRFYPSPYTLTANDQVTRTEMIGMKWFFNNKEITTSVTSITITPRRFADFLMTKEERRRHRPVLIKNAETKPPWHFGYTEKATLGESYTEDTYLLLNNMDKVIYEEVFPRMAEIRLLPTDFKKLEQDPLVDKLYSNGGLDVWYIHASASVP
ncbi:hypothetical protein ES702_02513 [subsurface metagenome]